MSRQGRAGGGGGGAAAGGGGCVRDELAMPELERINGMYRSPEVEEEFKLFKSKFTELANLQKQYADAMGESNPAVLKVAKTELLAQITGTPGVTDQARSIISGIFGVTEQVRSQQEQDDINAVLDCILQALIEDIPLPRVFQMVGKLFLANFYRNSPLRIAAGLSFVAASGYTAWQGGLGKLAGLSVDGCKAVFFGLVACYQFIDDINVSVPSSPEVFIGRIEQAGNASMAGSLFVPRGDLGSSSVNVSSSSPANASSLSLNPSQPDREIFGEFLGLLKAEAKNPATFALFLSHASLFLFDKIAPTDPAFQRLPQVQVPASAPPLGGESPFMMMSRELTHGGKQLGAITVNYLLRLLDILRKVGYQFPGRVGDPNNSYYHFICHGIGSLSGSMISAIKAQSIASGIDEEEQSAIFTKHLLDQILPQTLRSAAAVGDQFTAEQEVIFLAAGIKSKVMECCKEKHIGLDTLARLAPCFGSNLTTRNIEKLQEQFPNHVPEETRQLGDSQSAVASQTLPLERDAQIQPDFARILTLYPDLMVAADDKKALEMWDSEHKGLLGRFFGLPDAIVNMGKSIVGAVVVKTVGGSVSLLRNELQAKLGAPKEARRYPLPNPFPPEAKLWESVVGKALTVINEGSDSGETADEIKARLAEQFGNFGEPDEILRLVRSMIRISMLYSPKSNTFTLGVRGDGVNRRAVLLVNIESTPYVVGGKGEIAKTLSVPIEALDMKVPTPITESTLSGCVKGATSFVGSLWGGACRMFSKPAEPAEPAAPAEPAVMPPLPEAVRAAAAGGGGGGGVEVEEPPSQDELKKANELYDEALASAEMEQIVDDEVALLVGIDEDAEAKAAAASLMDMRSVSRAVTAFKSKRGVNSAHDVGDPESKRGGGKSRRKSRKNSKKTRRGNKGRATKNSKKTQQRRLRRSSRNSRK